MNNPNTLRQGEVVGIGGGSGLATLAEGIVQTLPNVHFTALVAGSDDGGSTGRLRAIDERMGAMGDIRKVSSAMAQNREAAGVMEDRLTDNATLESVSQMNARFRGAVTGEVEGTHDPFVTTVIEAVDAYAAEVAEKDSLDGHSYGNLVLGALAKTLDYDMTKAAQTTGYLLNLGQNHRVLPISNQPHALRLKDGDEYIEGQNAIAQHTIQNAESAAVTIDPQAHITPEAAAALQNADVRVYGPGSIYTSVGAVLAVEGTKDAIQNSKPGSADALNLNLVTDKETNGHSVRTIVQSVESQIGKDIDTILFNNDTHSLPGDVQPILCEDGDIKAIGHYVASYGAPLVSTKAPEIKPGDQIAERRTKVLTNAARIAELIADNLLHDDADAGKPQTPQAA